MVIILLILTLEGSWPRSCKTSDTHRSDKLPTRGDTNIKEVPSHPPAFITFENLLPIPWRFLGLSPCFPSHVPAAPLDPVQFQSILFPLQTAQGLDSWAPLGEEAGPGHLPPGRGVGGGVGRRRPGEEGGRNLNSLTPLGVGCPLGSQGSLPRGMKAFLEPFSAPLSPLSTPGPTSRDVGSVPPLNSMCAFPGSTKTSEGCEYPGQGAITPPSRDSLARALTQHRVWSGAPTPEFCSGSSCACP